MRIVERGTWLSMTALKGLQQPRYDSLESFMTQV